jgi:hypothetical protein
MQFDFKTKTPVFQHWGFLFLFWVWKGLIPQAGYRLFVTVQPFDDVMANYTSRNSNNKRNDIFHAVHLPSVPI